MLKLYSRASISESFFGGEAQAYFFFKLPMWFQSAANIGEHCLLRTFHVLSEMKWLEL